MSLTDVNQIANQVQERWAPMFMKELRESLLLGSLVNKDYQGAILNEGDTVYVSQINAPTGQLRTVGTDADSFDSQLLSTSRVSIVADKRAVAAFEMEDLVQLQSQLGSQDSEIRQALLFAVMQQVNDYLYSLVSPSTSAPDHLINSVSDMNAAQLAAIRLLAAKAKWRREGGWWGLLDPSYYSDVLNAATLTSKDYVGDEAPIVGGQISNPRMGFNLLEDNSRGTDKGLFFHPDFMHLVMQYEPRFKLSDLHSQKKFGFVLSADIVFGAKLGIDGDDKHIFATAAASGADAS
jgi:hypothetical protein